MTTSIFDRWSDLDTALALRRIEAAHGSTIFDRDAYTDPQHALKQIEAALGIELNDVAGASSFATLQDAIDAAITDVGDYVAKAVHFDGTVSFGTAALSALNSGLVLISIYVRKDDNPDDGQIIMQVDGRQPGGVYASGLIWQNSNQAPFEPTFDVYLSDSASNNFIGAGEYDTPIGWHNYLVYGDLNHADPDKRFKVYQDAVDVTFSPQNAGPGFVMTWNGKSFDIGSAGDGGNFLIGDLADFHIIIPSAPLSDETGGLPQATQRLFRDANGKPVDPAVAQAANLGTTIVLCTGDASTFAGDFTASPGSTGTLTNATTSPSD